MIGAFTKLIESEKLENRLSEEDMEKVDQAIEDALDQADFAMILVMLRSDPEEAIKALDAASEQFRGMRMGGHDIGFLIEKVVAAIKRRIQQKLIAG